MLVDDLRADRERLRQVNALLQLRQGLEAGRAGIEAREEALRLSVAELDERLARLEGEQARFHARLDRVAAHAAGHLDLITRHLESRAAGAPAARRPGAAEAGRGRGPGPAPEASSPSTWSTWSRATWSGSCAGPGGAPGRALCRDSTTSCPPRWPRRCATSTSSRATWPRPSALGPAHYDKATQASRFLGVTGMIALLLVRLPLAAGMLAASQALRYLARGRRGGRRARADGGSGQRAMRAGLERASEELGPQLEDYKTPRRRCPPGRRGGAHGVGDRLAAGRPRRARRGGSAARRPGRRLGGARAELDALLAREAAYEMALAGDKPADGIRYNWARWTPLNATWTGTARRGRPWPTGWTASPAASGRARRWRCPRWPPTCGRRRRRCAAAPSG